MLVAGPPCHRISLVLDVLASSFGAASYPNGCLNGFPGWATFCAALDISGTYALLLCKHTKTLLFIY